jgi:hypothetical protein
MIFPCLGWGLSKGFVNFRNVSSSVFRLSPAKNVSRTTRKNFHGTLLDTMLAKRQQASLEVTLKDESTLIEKGVLVCRFTRPSAVSYPPI